MKKGVRFHDRKRKFSFEKKENTMKRFDVQRILSVRKMKGDEKSFKDINKEIDDYFSSPDKYFQKNSPVTVGKKIYLLDINDPKLRRGKKLKTERKLATNIYSNLANYKYTNKNDNSNSSNNKKLDYQKYLDMSSKFEIIDNDRLKMIFNSYKIKDQKDKDNKDNSINDKSQLSSVSDSYANQLNENKKANTFNKKKYANPSLSLDNIPKEIKKCLFLQNKKLNLQKLSEKQNIRISRYLSKKLKKPQNNLLLNKIDSFRFKKEVINEIENNKPPEEQYGNGNFKWNISLRRPDHFQGVRKSYINLKGENYIPFWSLVIERNPKQKELSIKPNILNENDINQLKRQNKNIIFGKRNQYFKTVENLDNLNIEGKNLYNVEYKREIIDSKNKKILHKVFVENGKAISTADINNLYGNDTFYKDYSGCVTEKKSNPHKEIDFRDTLI